MWCTEGFVVEKIIELPDAAGKRTQTDAPLSWQTDTNGRPPANTNGCNRTDSRLKPDARAKYGRRVHGMTRPDSSATLLGALVCIVHTRGGGGGGGACANRCLQLCNARLCE